MITRLGLLLAVLAGGIVQGRAGMRMNVTAQAAEGVLAASLGLCSRYEQPGAEAAVPVLGQAWCSALRLLHASVFLYNHSNTYPGLKFAMGLLAAHDVAGLLAEYRRLMPAAEVDELMQGAPEQEEDHRLTVAPAAPLFSPETHATLREVELCAGLLLTLCSSHNATALRCEYAAALGFVGARVARLMDQHAHAPGRLACAALLGLLIADFLVPGSPFNEFAAQRDAEFAEYCALQPALAKNIAELVDMEEALDDKLETPLLRTEHTELTALNHRIAAQREQLRSMVCCTDVALQDVEGAMYQADVLHARAQDALS